jgi:hypothetical protein
MRRRPIQSGVWDAAMITGSAFSGLLTGVTLGFVIWHFI